MNPTYQSPLRVVRDPVGDAFNAHLTTQLKAKDGIISEKDARRLHLQQALATSEMRAQKFDEELRLERIKKYGKQSEKLSDLQLKLLDLEPAVSSDEITAEIERGTLSESTESENERRSRQNHPGRNELPSSLERIDKIIPCAPEFCTCGKCGGDTKVIGYEVSEVLDRKPAEYFVTRIMREKRACAHCIEQGVVTAPTPVRIAPKSIFSDETIVNFLISKYADATPLYRQRAGLQRDFDIDVALSTINDSVLRVSELLIPIIDWMKRDLFAGIYILADETYIGVQTEEKTGRNHIGYFGSTAHRTRAWFSTSR
jgi:transposase